MDISLDEYAKEDEEECDHSFILKDDIGYVCRVCGVVERSIESIIEFQRPKVWFPLSAINLIWPNLPKYYTYLSIKFIFLYLCWVYGAHAYVN